MFRNLHSLVTLTTEHHCLTSNMPHWPLKLPFSIQASFTLHRPFGTSYARQPHICSPGPTLFRTPALHTLSQSLITVTRSTQGILTQSWPHPPSNHSAFHAICPAQLYAQPCMPPSLPVCIWPESHEVVDMSCLKWFWTCSGTFAW